MAPRSKEQNQAQGEQTKQSLIITALPAFAEKVCAAASISCIAQEAGISKGLIYHYFSSKEDLLLDIFDYLNSFSTALFAKIKNHSPKERLRATIDMIFQYAETEAYFLEAALDGTALGKLMLRDRYPLAPIKAKLINHYQL
jgi:AcrR family transcriptional regulator